MSQSNPMPANQGRVLQIRERVADPNHLQALINDGVHPVLARVMAARGIGLAKDMSANLDGLIRPDSFRGLKQAASLMADAVTSGDPICVVGDYDCDGATASAVTIRGLRMLGAVIDYLVPNRFAHGYGLSPAVVDQAVDHPHLGKPRWIITVDNGIVSHSGVDRARELGIGVIITDHHLPGDSLPQADAIVNPNQPNCEFPSKHLAGVGVAFYLVAAVRSQLRERGDLTDPAPSLGGLLDLVALGTVADLVRLDDNNRRLIRAGMQRMRAGKACAGIRALLQVAGCTPSRLTVRDLGFALGPRINASGRLDDISTGVECLLADDEQQAAELAAQLDSINRERREIEKDMREIAFTQIDAPAPEQVSITTTHDSWHEGVVGLVASRLKDRFHRPVAAFAPARNSPGQLRGSGRSVPGVHLRDVFALIDSRNPSLITRFGGHAMAAGLSMPAGSLPQFEDAFEQAVADLAEQSAFVRELLVDGPLASADITMGLCQLLDDQVWGQGFAAPVFCNEFDLVRQRVVGNGHLKLTLRLDGDTFSGIFFRRDQPLPARPILAYQVEINEFRGLFEVQLVVQACANDGSEPL